MTDRQSIIKRNIVAIIVDKKEKRKNIALSCRKLLVENRIDSLTISQIAKTAGIGKGTFYEYFENKHEIIFELVNILMYDHNMQKEAKILQAKTTKEKIKIFYDFFYKEEDRDLRELYKDFIAISLVAPHDEMIVFQTNCFEYYYHWVEQIIEDGINNNEIIPQSKNLIKGLFAVGEGLFISSQATSIVVDLEKDINSYVDTMFELIQIKEKR